MTGPDCAAATRADIRELYDLQLRAFESEAEMIGSRNVPALLETWEHSLADFDNGTVLVRRDGSGRIFGAVRYRMEDGRVEIGRLMVAPEHRRQGVASDLMRAVEERTGARVFELYTCTKSWINLRLYEKLGYRTFKEERGEKDLSFAYMRKTLRR